MLVRFLSFAASVLGTARHRAILFSCLAVVFALGGIAGVALFHSQQLRDVASTALKTSAQSNGQQNPMWLEGGHQQNTKEELNQQPEPSSNAEQQPSAQGNPAPKNESTESEPATTEPELALSQSSVTLAAGTSKELTARTTLKGALTWKSSTPADTGTGLSVNSGQADASGSSMTFLIRTEQSLTPGVYQITISVKNAAGEPLSKTIDVIVE